MAHQPWVVSTTHLFVYVMWHKHVNIGMGIHVHKQTLLFYESALSIYFQHITIARRRNRFRVRRRRLENVYHLSTCVTEIMTAPTAGTRMKVSVQLVSIMLYTSSSGERCRSIRYVDEYPTMHGFGNSRHTESMIAYISLTEYFWRFK